MSSSANWHSHPHSHSRQAALQPADAPPQAYPTPLTNLIDSCFEEEQYQEGLDLLDQLRDSGSRPSNHHILLLFAISCASPPLNPPPKKGIKSTKSISLPKVPSIQTVLFSTGLINRFAHQNSLGVDRVLDCLPNRDADTSIDQDYDGEDDEDDDTRNLPLNLHINRIRTVRSVFDSLLLPDFYTVQSTQLPANGPSALANLKQRRRENSYAQRLSDFFGLEKDGQQGDSLGASRTLSVGNEDEIEEEETEEEDEEDRSFDYDLTSIGETKDFKKLVKSFESDLNKEVILQSGKKRSLKTLISLWKSQRENLTRTFKSDEETGKGFKELSLSKQFRSSKDSQPSLEITQVLDLAFAFFNPHLIAYQSFILDLKLKDLKGRLKRRNREREDDRLIGKSSRSFGKFNMNPSDSNDLDEEEPQIEGEMEEIGKLKENLKENEVERRARYSIGAELLYEVLHLASCSPPILDKDALIRGITSRLAHVDRLGLEVLFQTTSSHQPCLQILTRSLIQHLSSTRVFPSSRNSDSKLSSTIPNLDAFPSLKGQELTLISDLLKTLSRNWSGLELELNGKSSLLEMDLEDRAKVRKYLKSVEVYGKRSDRRRSGTMVKQKKESNRSLQELIAVEIALRLDRCLSSDLWGADESSDSVSTKRRFWKPISNANHERGKSSSNLRSSSTNSSSSSSNHQSSKRSSSRLSVHTGDVSVGGVDLDQKSQGPEQLSLSFLPGSNSITLDHAQLSFVNLEAKSLFMQLRLAEVRSEYRDLRILETVWKTLKSFHDSQGPMLRNDPPWNSCLESLKLLIKRKLKDLGSKVDNLSSKMKSDPDLKAEYLKVLLTLKMTSEDEEEDADGDGEVRNAWEKDGFKKEKANADARESKLGAGGDKGGQGSERGREVLRRLKDGVQSVESLSQELKGWNEVLGL